MLIETLTNFFAGEGGIWALCASAFLSATILPGSSEAILTAALASSAESSRTLLLVAAASLFNTLGSMTSWCIGRFIPDRLPDAPAVERVRRWGAAALFFAWVPIVGDMLPLYFAAVTKGAGKAQEIAENMIEWRKDVHTVDVFTAVI